MKNTKEIRDLIINVAVLYKKEVLSDYELEVAARIIIEAMSENLKTKGQSKRAC